MKFSDLSFKRKIALVLVLPMAGFLWLSIASILQSISTTQEMAVLNQLTRLSVVYSELVHELQKERGMTAGYLGSQGTKFAGKLKQQRIQTDEKIAAKASYWLDHKINHKQIIQLNQTINQRLSELDNVREQVETQSITLAQALSYYTQLNAKLLSVASLNVEISSNAQISKETIAYYSFLQGKERAGIERAVLTNTFANDQFGPGMLVKFITLVSEQTTYFTNFITFTNAANRQFLSQQLDHSAVREVLRLRDVATTTSHQFAVDPQYWFAQSTGRIVQLKQVENHLASALLNLVTVTEDAAVNTMLVNSIVTLLIIMLAISIGFYTITELNARVKELTSVMGHVMEHNDLTVQAQLLGHSELGEISAALNATLKKFSHVIEQMSASSINSASAAQETSLVCDDNSSNLLEQQDQMGLIATAVEQLSIAANEITTHTQTTAGSARNADEQAQKGLAVVQQSYQSIEALADEIDRLAERVQHLQDSSANITTLVDVIKSVADQTNLLALNAAIEAARAGQQGRGFAVVADEVRTLALRTQQSTSEIERFISALQADVGAAFNVIASSQQKAATAVTNAKSVEHTLAGITGAVTNIFVMTQQIATTIEQQGEVTLGVAQNIVNVEKKSLESTSGATQIAVTARQQAQQACELQQIASIFKV